MRKLSEGKGYQRFLPKPRVIYGALAATYGTAFVSHGGDPTYFCAAIAYLALARTGH